MYFRPRPPLWHRPLSEPPWGSQRPPLDRPPRHHPARGGRALSCRAYSSQRRRQLRRVSFFPLLRGDGDATVPSLALASVSANLGDAHAPFGASSSSSSPDSESSGVVVRILVVGFGFAGAFGWNFGLTLSPDVAPTRRLKPPEFFRPLERTMMICLSTSTSSNTHKSNAVSFFSAMKTTPPKVGWTPPKVHAFLTTPPKVKSFYLNPLKVKVRRVFPTPPKVLNRISKPTKSTNKCPFEFGTILGFDLLKQTVANVEAATL